MQGTRNHHSNDNAIPCKVTESLEPTSTIIQETIPLEKRCVEAVCIIDKFLNVFQSDLGREGRASQILEEAIKVIGPEANDYVVLLGYVSKRSGDA